MQPLRQIERADKATQEILWNMLQITGAPEE